MTDAIGIAKHTLDIMYCVLPKPVVCGRCVELRDEKVEPVLESQSDFLNLCSVNLLFRQFGLKFAKICVKLRRAGLAISHLLYPSVPFFFPLVPLVAVTVQSPVLESLHDDRCN